MLKWLLNFLKSLFKVEKSSYKGNLKNRPDSFDDGDDVD